jgi:hypothetical protein
MRANSQACVIARSIAASSIPRSVIVVSVTSHQSLFLNPQSSTINPQSSTVNPQSLLNPQPPILNTPSSILSPQSSILNPPSSTHNLQPSILDPQSSTLYQQSSIINHQAHSTIQILTISYRKPYCVQRKKQNHSTNIIISYIPNVTCYPKK